MFWVIYMAYRVGASPKTYERRARAACNFCHCLGTKSFLKGCFVQANGPRFVAWKYETVCGVVRYLRNVNF